jgi:hypothetical protein
MTYENQLPIVMCVITGEVEEEKRRKIWEERKYD